MEPYVRLLGQPCIEVGGVVNEPEASRASGTLYYLASKAGWVSRDELTYLFWPDGELSKSQLNLRQLIHSIRRTPYAHGLEVERSRLRWRVVTDVWQASQTDRSRPLSNTDALREPGTFMAGFQLKNAPEFDQWLEHERAYWGQRLRADLMRRMEELLAVSDVSTAYTTIKTWLGHDPLDEDLVYRALELCWRYGWVDAGERLYQAFKAELVRELGLRPSERIDSARAALLDIIHAVPRPTDEDTVEERHVSFTRPTSGSRRMASCQPIEAGRHRTKRLPILLTFTVRDGWEIPGDTPARFAIGRVVDEFRERYYLASEIAVRYNVHALVQTCEEGILADVPIDSKSLSTHWRSLPSVDSTWPTAVEVGGLTGLTFDVSINPSTTQVCEWTQGRPVALLMAQPGPNGLQHGIHAGERLRLSILDHLDGNVIIEVVHTPHTPMSWAAWMELTGTIIDTFEFEVP